MDPVISEIHTWQQHGFGTEKRQVTPGWELKQRYHALTTCGDTRTGFPKTESAGSPCTAPVVSIVSIVSAP
jgi:hypothetical protein